MPLRNDVTTTIVGNYSPRRRSITDRESLGSHSTDTSINEMRQQLNLFDDYSSYYESDEDDSELITFHESNADTMNDFSNSITTLDNSLKPMINQSTEGSSVGEERNTTSITQILNSNPAPASVSFDVFRSHHDDQQSTSSNDDDDFKQNLNMPLHYESSDTNKPLQVSNLIPTRYVRPSTSMQSCNEISLLGSPLGASEHSTQEPPPEDATLSTSYSTNAQIQDANYHNNTKNHNTAVVQPILSTSHMKAFPSLNKVHFTNQDMPSVEYYQEFRTTPRVNFDEEGQQCTLAVDEIGDNIQPELNTNSTSDCDTDKDEYIVFDHSSKFDRRVLSSQSDFSTKTTLQPGTGNRSQTIINIEHDQPFPSIIECMAIQASANTTAVAACCSNIVVTYSTSGGNPTCRKVSKSGICVAIGSSKLLTRIFFTVITIAAIASVSVGAPLLRGTVKSSQYNVTSTAIQNKTDSNLIEPQTTDLDSDTTHVSDAMTDAITHDMGPNILSTQQNQNQQTKQETNTPTKVGVQRPATKPNERIPESFRPRSVKPTNKPIPAIIPSLLTDYTQSEARRNQPTISAPVPVSTTKTQSPIRAIRTSRTITPVIAPTPSPKAKTYATVQPQKVIKPTPSPKAKTYATLRPQKLQMQTIPIKKVSALSKQRWTKAPVQLESIIVNASPQKPSSPSQKPSKKPNQKRSKRPTQTQSTLSPTQQHPKNPYVQQQNPKNHYNVENLNLQQQLQQQQQKTQTQQKQTNPSQQQQMLYAKKQQPVQYPNQVQVQQPMYIKQSQQTTTGSVKNVQIFDPTIIKIAHNNHENSTNNNNNNNNNTLSRIT